MLHCLWAAKCRILALQHQAHGHAMLGDRAAADRLLDTASATTVAWMAGTCGATPATARRTTSRCSVPPATAGPVTDGAQQRTAWAVHSSGPAAVVRMTDGESVRSICHETRWC